MPRRAIGDRPMTAAERSARRRRSLLDRIEQLTAALEAVGRTTRVADAKAIAAEALAQATPQGAKTG